MRIYDFFLEGRSRCFGSDAKEPRFSWKMQSDKKNTMQHSFELKVLCGSRECWKAKSISQQSSDILYRGEALRPRTAYTAQVTVTDNYGEKDTAVLSFETGKFDEPFAGEYISLHEKEAPVYALVKKIALSKPIKSARLYATALGVYEFYVNGSKAGNLRLAPFWTDYRHTIEYQTYDITRSLQAGENLLQMYVGKGWYAGALGFAGEKANYGEKTAGLAEIRVAYEDGTEDVFGTDASWHAETTEIVDSEFYYGETQDFARVPKQYSVAVLPRGGWRIIGQLNEPVRVIEEIAPAATIVTPKGEYVVDFGQNLVGVVKIAVKRPYRGKITVGHAEVLDRAGNFYTENLRTAVSTDVYMLTGNETELVPKFTWHGFRYIRVIAERPEDLVFTAQVIHSDLRKTGTFRCSHPKIGQLQHNIVWGQRGNFVDVPTDCPQRDERLGWTGDANVFFRTAAFNYDVSQFFDKWLRDVRTEQDSDGNVPHVIPNTMGKQDGAALWSDCATMIPWNYYRVYGSKILLEKQYLSMKNWVDYVYKKCGKNGLWQEGFQYGDWLALDSGNAESRTGATDKYFVANVFYFVSTEIVAQTAKVLDNLDDYEDYSERKDRILRAIRREYFTETGRMVSETQTACALALYFDIAPKKFRGQVMKALKNNLAENKNHLNTGFAGTPFLLHALSMNGEHELAGKILFNEDYPSWLYAVDRGATTIWERWNGILPDGELYDPAMNSFNHYSYGCVGDFLYRRIAGLNEAEPGYKKILIRPNPTQNIEYAEAEYDSVYGKIVSGYVCKNGKLRVYAQIPPNTTAEIVLPETGQKHKVGSGRYEYEYETSLDLTPRRFTMDTLFGAVADLAEGRQILEELSPGILSGPMIAFAYNMTLAEVAAFSGQEGIDLFRAVLQRLNALKI